MKPAILTSVVSPTLSRQLFMMAKQYDDVVDFTLGDPYPGIAFGAGFDN